MNVFKVWCESFVVADGAVRAHFLHKYRKNICGLRWHKLLIPIKGELSLPIQLSFILRLGLLFEIHKNGDHGWGWKNIELIYIGSVPFYFSQQLIKLKADLQKSFSQPEKITTISSINLSIRVHFSIWLFLFLEKV